MRDRFRSQFSLGAILLVILVAGSAGPARAVTVVNASGANHISFSICPALDGANFLDPDPPVYLGTVSQAMIDELANGDTAYPGWTFQSATNPLAGTFTIDEYKSRFVAVHRSGSEINMRYKRGAGDPANLRWAQCITTNSPIDPNGANPPPPPTSPYMDPYPDDADGEGGPFYYSDQAGSEFDYRDHINGAADYGFGTDYDVHFYDFPTRTHPPTSYVEWHGELWLTDLGPGTNVIFYGGFKYGFKAGCIAWLPPLGFTFGTTATGVSYDPSSGVLSVYPSTIDVLNQTGSQVGVDPIFASDPALHAQMMFTPFERVMDVQLPLGLALFRGGSVHVIGSGGFELFHADIPYLVLGDDMNPAYNMTGVYAHILSNGSESPFFSQYESFRIAGQGQGGTESAGNGADRTNRNGATSDTGPGVFDAAGYTPQLYVRTGRTVQDLLTNGGTSAAGLWNSFGQRNPNGGLVLRVGRSGLSWGALGTSVVYDVIRGDLGPLRASGGNFSIATQECLGNDLSVTGVNYSLNPMPGQGYWFLVRAIRGSIVGTYDTLQPKQVASRDPGIAASPGLSHCP